MTMLGFLTGSRFGKRPPAIGDVGPRPVAPTEDQIRRVLTERNAVRHLVRVSDTRMDDLLAGWSDEGFIPERMAYSFDAFLSPGTYRAEGRWASVVCALVLKRPCGMMKTIVVVVEAVHPIDDSGEMLISIRPWIDQA